jgi:hypothetical protein
LAVNLTRYREIREMGGRMSFCAPRYLSLLDSGSSLQLEVKVSSGPPREQFSMSKEAQWSSSLTTANVSRNLNSQRNLKLVILILLLLIPVSWEAEFACGANSSSHSTLRSVRQAVAGKDYSLALTYLSNKAVWHEDPLWADIMLDSAILGQGYKLLSEGKFREALSVFDCGVSELTSSCRPKVRHFTARALIGLDRYEDAMANLDTLRSETQWKDAFLECAEDLNEKGLQALVLRALQLAASCQVSDTVIYRELARQFRLVGRTNEADSLDAATGAIRPLSHTPPFEVYFYIPRSGKTVFQVYDVLGRRILLADKGEMPAGLNSIIWDGSDSLGTTVTAGRIYLVRLSMNTGDLTGKILFLK